MAIPDLVFAAIWVGSAVDFWFVFPSKITSSLLTDTALSGRASTAMRAHGMPTLPDSFSSSGSACASTSAFIFNFAIDCTSTRNCSVLTRTREFHCSKLRHEASPSRVKLLSAVLIIPSKVERLP